MCVCVCVQIFFNNKNEEKSIIIQKNIFDYNTNLKFYRIFTVIFRTINTVFSINRRSFS
jgi:hypothetical protein